ncbi:MAG: GntR family transcriptional regulator, partial [Chloroflexota bacterium]
MPLYYQLHRLLLAKIESGELQAGDAFPTEQQIQDTYDVSRTTVRQALGELEDAGKIVRQRGRGTFVAKPKMSHHPDSYPQLADYMTEQGVKPGWRLLNNGWTMPADSIASALGIEAGNNVYRLERLRLENDTPIGYHTAYVAPDYTTHIDDSNFTTGGSLRYLHRLGGLNESMADRTLEALAANERVANLLEVPVGVPLLRVKRVVYSTDSARTPIELLFALYRGDRFEYHINNMRAIGAINA